MPLVIRNGLGRNLQADEVDANFRLATTTWIDNAGPRPQRSAKYFGVVDSTNIDQTTAINAACDDASREGYDIFWPPGTYIRTGAITNPTSWFGAGSNLVEHRNNGTLGVGGKIECSDDNITISGIRFTAPNTPLTAINDATETSTTLRFTSVKNSLVEKCEFNYIYGGGVLFRNVTRGAVRWNVAKSMWKDWCHTTGASTDITVENNIIENCGDDGIAVVGYDTGSGTLGQPTNVIIRNNTIRGQKFARGIAVVGGKDVEIYDNHVDGLMPSDYPSTAPDTKNYRMLCGLYIATESVGGGGAYSTYAPENIKARNNKITNCGYTSEFSGSQLSAVQIVGRAGVTLKNIDLDVDISNVGTIGIYASGGTTGGIEGLTLTGSITDNTDPNGWFGTAGAGTANAIEVQNVKNHTVNMRLDTIGGAGGYGAASCTGYADINIETKKINKSGTAGKDFWNFQTGSSLSDIYYELTVLEQANVASAGTAYYIERLLECVNAGKVRKCIITDYAGLAKTPLLGVAVQTIAVGASPFTWTNTNPYPVNARVVGGTVSSIQRGMTTGVASPVYSTVPNRTFGVLHVQPGESLITTYSSAPTMDYTPSTS